MSSRPRSSWPSRQTPHRRCFAPSTTSRGGTRPPTCAGLTSSRSGSTRWLSATATFGRHGGRAPSWSAPPSETGRWDEALEHAEGVIAYVEAGNPLYAEASCRLVRATITFARGDASMFDAEIDRSLALAAEATDPQAKGPVSVYAAYLRLWAGDRTGAQQLLDSTLATARTTDVGIGLIHYEAALLAALLGLDPAELAIPRVEVTDTPRQRATAALLEGDLLEAADALAELGKVDDEAYLRLRLGERLAGRRARGRRASAGGASARILPRRPRNSVHRRGRGAPCRHPPTVGLESPTPPSREAPSRGTRERVPDACVLVKVARWVSRTPLGRTALTKGRTGPRTTMPRRPLSA